MTQEPEVAIVGMGYVGLTLAVTLAELGIRVWGYERQPEIVRQLNSGHPHLYEPGLAEALQRQIGRNLTVSSRMPEEFSGITVICVSTPIGADRSPDLRNLRAATEAVADAMREGAPVIVRSTVPVGTCRGLVLPVLQRKQQKVCLAFCPERTIQGQALRELTRLPQVVGGLDEASTQTAVQFWKRVTRRVVPVSSLEAAEMVKLINNCHTDVLYSFGNEVALMAQRLGLDPMELIGAANVDYPRPAMARPGFVAGPCMTKDPHLLLSSLKSKDHVPQLVAAARALNESLPETVARHFVDTLQKIVGSLDGAKVLVCGFAYKGTPPTDDMRDTPTVPILNVLRQHPLRLYGHDYFVPSEKIEACGVAPVRDLCEGFRDARGVLVVNEHPDYRRLDIKPLAMTMRPPAVLYDCWRLFDQQAVESIPGLHYRGIGYG